MIEVAHDLLEFPLPHLPMAHGHPSFGNEGAQPLSGLLDGAHLVVHEEHLSSPEQLPEYRFLH